MRRLTLIACLALTGLLAACGTSSSTHHMAYLVPGQVYHGIRLPEDLPTNIPAKGSLPTATGRHPFSGVSSSKFAGWLSTYGGCDCADEIAAEFTVPTFTCSNPNQIAGIWVGIGGYGAMGAPIPPDPFPADNLLTQDGIAFGCNGRKALASRFPSSPTYAMFEEEIGVSPGNNNPPAYELPQFAFQVFPGDKIYSAVFLPPSGTVDYLVADLTTGQELANEANPITSTGPSGGQFDQSGTWIALEDASSPASAGMPYIKDVSFTRISGLATIAKLPGLNTGASNAGAQSLSRQWTLTMARFENRVVPTSLQNPKSDNASFSLVNSDGPPPVPKSNNSTSTAFSAARAQWELTVKVPAAFVDQRQMAAANDLKSANNPRWTTAIRELTQLAFLPVTSDTAEQMAQAEADTSALDTFFDTPGLQPNG